MTPILARGLFDDMGEYERMEKNDGVVRGWFYWIVRNLMRGKWLLDEHDKPTRDEKRLNKLVRSYLGVSEDGYDVGTPALMRGGLRRLVMHACQKFKFGFSLMEIAWDVHEHEKRQYWLPSRLQWRAPRSVNRIIYGPDDSPVAIEQVLQRNPEGYINLGGDLTERGLDTEKEYRIIPIDRLLCFQHMGLDGNFEAESLFRAAWPWYRAKMDTVKRDQRGQDRLIDGMTIFKELGTSEGVFQEVTEADLDEAIETYIDWYNGISPVLVEPFGIGIDHTWPANDVPPPEARVMYYDSQILMSAGAPIIGVFAGQAGARDFQEVTKSLANSLEQMAADIAEVINGVPGLPWTGLINRIAEANFDTKGMRLPVLRCSAISFQDIERVVAILSRAEQFLLYTPMAEDEHVMRGAIGLKKMALEDIEAAREAQAQKAGQSSQQGTQGSQGPQASPQSIRSKTEAIESSNDKKGKKEDENGDE